MTARSNACRTRRPSRFGGPREHHFEGGRHPRTMLRPPAMLPIRVRWAVERTAAVQIAAALGLPGEALAERPGPRFGAAQFAFHGFSFGAASGVCIGYPVVHGVPENAFRVGSWIFHIRLSLRGRANDLMIFPCVSTISRTTVGGMPGNGKPLLNLNRLAKGAVSMSMRSTTLRCSLIACLR